MANDPIDPTDIPNATINDMTGVFTRPEIWAFVPNTAHPHEFYKTAAVARFDWKDVAKHPHLAGPVDHVLGQVRQPLTTALLAALPDALHAAGGGDVKIERLAEALAKVLVEQFKPGKDVKPADGREPTLVLGVIPPGEQVAAYGIIKPPRPHLDYINIINALSLK
jgi:hypothetical protein